jgi:hypothetical protein
VKFYLFSNQCRTCVIFGGVVGFVTFLIEVN